MKMECQSRRIGFFGVSWISTTFLYPHVALCFTSRGILLAGFFRTMEVMEYNGIGCCLFLFNYLSVSIYECCATLSFKGLILLTVNLGYT